MERIIIIACAITFIVSCSDSGPTDSEGPVNEEPVEEPTNYELATEVAPSEGGNISPDEGEYEENSEIEIQASPNEHWEFAEWEGDFTGEENPFTLTMDEDKSITASFIPKMYQLTLETEGEGTVNEEVISQKASNEYSYGDDVELTAEPAEEWIFDKWEGDLTESENPVVIAMDGDKNFTAVFEKRYKEMDEAYEANNGITVTLQEVNKHDGSLYDSYAIVYTVENTTDDFIFEGYFKMYYSNSGTEGAVMPQDGTRFGELAPGKKSERLYAFNVEKENSSSIYAIAYIDEMRGDDSETPPEDALVWKVNS